MLHPRWLYLGAASLIIAIGVVSLLSLTMGTDDMKRPNQGRRYEIEVLDSTDAVAMKEWAQQMCRGATVVGLASALGVEPTMEAVVGYLSKGHTGDAQKAVVETCERELKRQESLGGAGS